MKIIKPNPWGLISGKLKITPELAKELFDFDMKPDEKYVIFKIRDGENHICHYTKPKEPETEKQKNHKKLFKMLSKIAYQNRQNLIKPIWDKFAKNKPYTGVNLFIGVNIKRIYKKSV